MAEAAATRPRVTLKTATSLDGRIATADGASKWITGAQARAAGHRLRGAHDAIIVGSGTALLDDPELTARGDPAPVRQPLRVVVDTKLRLSPTSRLLQTISLGPVLILGGRNADREAKAAIEAAGGQVALLPHDVDGVDLSAALTHLRQEHGVETLLVEGGGGLFGAFLAAGCADRLEWFRAPIVIGQEGRPAAAGLGVERLDHALRFRRVALREVGEDVWESYERA